MKSLSKKNIKKYLKEISVELSKEGLKGEILILGGAMMVLVFNARTSTKDVDAIFYPKVKIYELSKKITEKYGLPENWLNDSVKGFIKKTPLNKQLLIRFDNLLVYVPEPEYILAMKSISMRIGIESSDIEDLKFLINYLKLKSAKDIFKIIEKYYPQNQIPQKTYYAIEEILQKVL